MGVKGFKKIIETFAQKCVKQTEFKEYKGQVVPLDGSITLYKFCIAVMNTENYKSPAGEVTGHLFACFFKTSSMLKYGIMPLWVFDGKPPEIKNDTISERKKIKQNALNKLMDISLQESEKIRCEKKTFSVTSKQIDEIKYLLSLIGLPYSQSPGEAEAQCAAFDISNISNGIVTEDWDAILFGCKKMLKDFSNKTTVKEINTSELLKTLGMTREQLIDLGSILGNDYCNGIGGLKPEDAYRKFKEANYNMNTFITNIAAENSLYKKYKIPSDFIEKWIESKEYYLNAYVSDPNKLVIKWNEPNYELIYDFLVNKKGFKEDIILQKINELKIMYHYYIHNNNELITLSRIKKELKINVPLNNISYMDTFLETVCKFPRETMVRC
ncbi:FLAP endonuclease-1 [Fadolivirus algeromassiliense]|jgi:flap endonuclease-1|uniref:FLAP endonuclease-1 n=1 Tax=Fadolivirus FV1/VV64 TaxID=3070911 RepID=A0A7D3QTZ5_9VIRU|nr:FLAP endonuclease-1 [Fadolivirus algeromassiliense]QKF93747.1 FLAP endonuclease-1 [Fadolivirus FV1/VV64]